ncbi:MAG TPA: MogA/MoaB family molybdenum cofactor biosynthesis protein [Terriglobales bacterium]|nr:MogA/MoaB family molybdenum cofactor biosynthesis protein [Terriglobales bacterium]
MKLETKAAILTVSDSASAGKRPDLSGPAVKELLQQNHLCVEKMEIVADEQPAIEAALRRLAASAQLVVTTGGTGIAIRDVTPEATRAVCTRLVEGIAERMRSEGAKKTPLAALSRGVCGICGTSLILNLPGSPKAAVESLQAVIELLPHMLDLLQGNTSHTNEHAD